MVLGALAVVAACGEHGPAAVIQASRGPVTVAVEVAATDSARAQGLMYRRELADGRGMVFVFPDEAEHSFWMKNTMIALDMLFVAGDGYIVGIHANAAPLSLTPISVGKASKWVIEVPAGFSERSGIAVGDQVRLRDVPSA
jgi:uncharacterized membrane protein (UPF0127 family)